MTERYYGHAPSEVRAAAVKRYLTSDLTQEEVAEQFGTTKGNISYWVKAAGSHAVKKKNKPTSPKTSEAVEPLVTLDGRSAQEKLRLLMEAARLADAERGEFFRREGLRDGDLERLEAEALGGLGGKVRSFADQRRIQELERVNAKQEKRLREAEVLLELQKKVQELWGAKDDDTPKR
jgi:transposase-like protein